ncbi:putative undecaprenyl-phosphate N-acetylglucosaminyl 1-phosphate transferase [Streptomyces sp. YIM 130001]|uniref:MraY family glycosyltransferase n=1 Tax=Streptomyces sp. YIM 130001 TaxID=2259644 RepID=UPI000E651147|nr:MraY family glycosyltransferase [Streptomyces sp. YIM 130001]RII08610.1 putative undecaprenyl-phosphate N-acetylglucosaminyl 1-phosphate transferase [Streptomyces sp. YIM 130001]
MLYGTVAVLSAVILTAVLARGVRALCLRTGVLDRPGGRKVHARPTPHLGGIAVAGGTFVVCCTGYAPLGDDVRRLLWAAAAVALLGLIDDLRPLGPLPRLVVETAAACAVVFGSGLSPAAGFLAVGWIVFVTNAFNLLDNSDGAVGTVGVVTALGLALCAAAGGRSGLTLLLVVLAASLAGFLTLNWHPARIFLGDCGALFTGFVLGAAGVLVHAGRDVLPSAAALFAVSAVVTADTVLVVASRRRAGRPLLLGGTDHIAHRLRRIGFTVPGAAVVLGAAAFASSLVGVLIHRDVLGPSAALPLLCLTAAAVLALLRVRVYGVRGRRGPGSGRGVATRTGARGGAGARTAAGKVTGPRRAPRPPGGVPATRAAGGAAVSGASAAFPGAAASGTGASAAFSGAVASGARASVAAAEAAVFGAGAKAGVPESLAASRAESGRAPEVVAEPARVPQPAPVPPAPVVPPAATGRPAQQQGPGGDGVPDARAGDGAADR